MDIFNPLTLPVFITFDLSQEFKKLVLFFLFLNFCYPIVTLKYNITLKLNDSKAFRK